MYLFTKRETCCTVNLCASHFATPREELVGPQALPSLRDDVRDDVPALDWHSGARPRSFHPRADVEDRAGVPADYGPDVGRPDEVPDLPASLQVCGIDR